jgi:CheY-like chemotaxis protein
VSRQRNHAQVVVSDTGIGISPEFLPSAFDIFRQQEQGTRRAQEGLGIGLALVKQLVELQKGTATIASAGAGQGTDLTVTFPLVADAAARDRPVSPAVAENPTKSIRGLSELVIEDSDDSRESLRLLLEQHGATISSAHDGQEALELIAKVAPDVVLCDLRMPRMDGYEFLRELHRRRLEAPPVIAMSGLASADDRRRTRDAGFRGHVSKPFDIAAMIDAVEHAAGAGRKQSAAGVQSPMQ